MAIYATFGKIKGPVTAKGFENHIQLHAAAVSAHRSVSMVVGTGKNREADSPHLQEFTVFKAMDKASPQLWMNSLTGKVIDKVEIKFVKTSEDALEQYLCYTLENVLVSSYVLDDEDARDPVETVTLAYNKIQMRYCPRKPDNSLGDPIPAGYDVKLGKKL